MKKEQVLIRQFTYIEIRGGITKVYDGWYHFPTCHSPENSLAINVAKRQILDLLDRFHPISWNEVESGIPLHRELYISDTVRIDSVEANTVYDVYMGLKYGVATTNPSSTMDDIRCEELKSSSIYNIGQLTPGVNAGVKGCCEK